MGTRIETFTTLHGRFAIDTIADAKMAEMFARGTHHQEDVIDLISAFIHKESIVIDIGAHIGTLAIPLARRAKKVIAFEPVPSSFALLKQNVELNGVSIDTRNKGLAEHRGHARLKVVNVSNAGANTLTPGEGELVLSILDDEVESADFIKIDVEGMELGVLRGGMRLIKNSRPSVLFEVNLYQLRAHDTALSVLQSFFSMHEYALYIPVRTSRGLELGSVMSLPLLTACIAPRALLFGGPSAPFDVLAVPEEKQLPLPRRSPMKTMQWVVTEYVRNKAKQWHI